MKVHLLKVTLLRALGASGTLVLTVQIPLVLNLTDAAYFLSGMAFLYFASICTKFGLDFLILKNASTRFNSNKNEMTITELSIVMTPFFLSIFVSILFYIVASESIINNFVWVALCLPAFTTLGMFTMFWRGCGREYLAALAEVGVVSLISSLVLGFISTFYPIFIDIGIIFCASSWLILFLNLLQIKLTWKKNSNFFKDIFKKLNFRSASYFYLTQVSSYASQWYPVFLFGSIDVVFVVYYSVAIRIASMINFIGMSIDAYASPRFANAWSMRDISKLINLKRKFDRYGLVLALSAFIIVYPLAIMYGLISDYGNSYYKFSLALLTASVIAISLGPNGFFLSLTSENYYVTIVTLYTMFSIIFVTTLLYNLGFFVHIVYAVAILQLLKYFLFYVRTKLFIKGLSGT